MKTRITLFLLLLAFGWAVQAANPTCGLTIITHGFQPPWPAGNGALPGWVREMAKAITNRIGSAIPIYRVRYDKATDAVLLEDGETSIDITTNGGAIILLDWVGASDQASQYAAQDVADHFFSYLFQKDHSGHSLVEVPIHLIGHSRGCSLNSRLAQLLAANGILMDQVTTLDPHPVRPFDPLPPDGGNDLIPVTYSNVIFADNYYQQDDFPEGREIAGAFNQNLSSVLTGILPGTEHGHVHTYYHGTVDITAGPGTEIDGDHIVAAWYDGTLHRDETGFNFSRYTNPLLDRPASGVNQSIAGAGGTGIRVFVDTAFQFWPNVGFDQRGIYPERVTVGQTVSIPYYYSDRNSQQTITFFTDIDTNPFNGERESIGSVTQSGRPAGSIGQTGFSWTPTAADVGTHYIGVKTTNTRVDLNRVRYDYFFKQITVEAATTPVPIISSVSPRTLTALPLEQRQLITITGTEFTSGSRLTFNNGTTTFADRVPTFISATELRYSIGAGPNPAKWTAKVVNGAVESLPYTFYVVTSEAQLTGLSINGPATINENGTGQFTAQAVFSDGSKPTVTGSCSWSVSGGSASISPSGGLLTAGSVGANTGVTVTATYSVGSVTKSSSGNVMILNTGSGGGFTTKELIANGGFESGKTVWHANALAGGAATSADILQGSFPHQGGTWYAYVGDRTTSSVNALGALFQVIDIPADATAIELNFYLNIVSQEPTAGLFDKMEVNLRTASDSFIAKLKTYSEGDKGSNSDGSYGLRTIDMTDALAAYKGKQVILQFYVDTDPGKSTIFRIDDVSVTAKVPASRVPESLAISGPSSIAEGTTADYLATLIYSNGTTETIPALAWASGNPSVASLLNGQLSAAEVEQDTVVSIYAGAQKDGKIYGAYKDVTIVNQTAVYNYLALRGPGSLIENTSSTFGATAIYSDGSEKPISADWQVVSGPASISNSGLLTAGEVRTDTIAKVFAIATLDGITKSATQDLLILNSVIPPVLNSLSISGPTSVNENSTAQFSATASFSDGSSKAVVPTWSENDSATSISGFGLFSAGEMSSDTTITVSASYTVGGITRSASQNVLVVNVAPGCVATLLSPTDGATVNTPPTLEWSLTENCFSQVYIATNALTGEYRILPQSFSSGSHTFALSEEQWEDVANHLGYATTYYWAIGEEGSDSGQLVSAWRSFNVAIVPPPTFALTTTGNGGTVVRNPDQASYQSGSLVTLTAQADPGYEFTGWDGGATGADNPLTITVDRDTTISALFAVVPTSLRIQNPILRGDGSFQFLVVGAPNQQFELESSTDLLVWNPTGSGNTGAGGSQPTAMSRNPNEPSRYYRVKAAAAAGFFDDFNRPDSEDVGNGWLTLSGSDGGQIAIRNQLVTSIDNRNGFGGIYRPMKLDQPFRASLTLYEFDAGSGARYEYDVAIVSDGAIAHGYRLRLASNRETSSIGLIDGDNLAGDFIPTFHFGSSVKLEFTARPDGSINGIVSDSGNGEIFTPFSFPAKTILSTGDYFAIGMDFSTPIAARVDDVKLEPVAP